MFKYVTIEFPLAQKPPQRLQSFTLTQERYAHEIAVVKFRDWNIQYSNIRAGEPVKCILRGKDSSREFVGYIHDIKPQISPGKRFVEMTLIGASYKLKQQRQRVFENVTASEVVSSIAREYGLTSYVENHPRIYEQITQAGHTELQFMTRLARQCGYSLRIENTSLYFQSLTADFTKYRNSAKRFFMNESNDPAGSTLYSFELTLGESVQYLDAYKSAAQVGGVGARSAEANIFTNPIRPETLRETSRTEFFDSFATDVVAPSYETALYEAQAVDLRNRFPYRARVQVIGTPTISPDKPVYLSGLGKDYTGYWVVLSAQHHIIETAPNVLQYTTYLEVGSDSIGDSSVFEGQFSAQPAEVSPRSIVPNVRNVADNPTPVLTKGSQLYANDGFAISTNRPQSSVVVDNTAYTWVSTKLTDNPNNVDDRNRTAATHLRLAAKNVL